MSDNKSQFRILALRMYCWVHPSQLESEGQLKTCPIKRRKEKKSTFGRVKEIPNTSMCDWLPSDHIMQPCPRVWGRSPPGKERRRAPSFLPGTQRSKNHVCNHIPLSTEDLKKRLTLGNADFQVFKRNNNEVAAKSILIIKKEKKKKKGIFQLLKDKKKIFQIRLD